MNEGVVVAVAFFTLAAQGTLFLGGWFVRQIGRIKGVLK